MQRGQKIPAGSLDAGRKPAKQQKTHQGLSFQMQERSWKRNPGYSWPFVSEELQQNSSLTHHLWERYCFGWWSLPETWVVETRNNTAKPHNSAIHVTRLSCCWREGQKEAPGSGICIKLTVVGKLQSQEAAGHLHEAKPGKNSASTKSQNCDKEQRRLKMTLFAFR